MMSNDTPPSYASVTKGKTKSKSHGTQQNNRNDNFEATILGADDWNDEKKLSKIYLRVGEREKEYYVGKKKIDRDGLIEIKEGTVIRFQPLTNKGHGNVMFGRILQIIKFACFYCWQFGICRDHDVKNYLGHDVEKEFEMAKVESIENMRITTQDEAYQIPNINWYCFEKPEKYDWILLEVSKKRDKTGAYFARILKVFRKWLGGKPDIRLYDAFTIDPSETKRKEDAFSINECSEHGEGCLVVGIHIVAVSLYETEKVDESYLTQFCLKGKLKNIPCFSKGNYTLAFSGFFHTKDDDTQLKISMIHITEEYDLDTSETDSEEIKRFHRLVNVMHRGNWIGDDDRLHKYLVAYGHRWKYGYLSESLIQRYWKIVKEKCSSHNFISTKWQKDLQKKTNTVMISRDEYEAIKGAKKPGDLSSLLLVVSRGRRYIKTVSDETETGRSRYVFGLNRDNDENVDYRVKCASPAREVFQFINQQILHNAVVSAPKAPYSDDELLGIMTVRFPKPKLVTTVVERIHDGIFVLLHSEFNLDSSLIEVPFSAIGFHKPRIENKIAVITYKNLSCDKEDDYLNRETLLMSCRNFDSLVKSISDLEESKEFVPGDQIQFETISAPYIKSGKDTQLHLQPGVELQIQISNQDAKEKNGLGLRMLRIGIDCNLCFMHTEHPEMVFLSCREDIRNELLTKQRVKNLKSRRLMSVRRMDSVQITWTDDRYYCGGTFETVAPSEEKAPAWSSKSANEVVKIVKEGDLLCIFEKTKGKDLTGFIWNCHGVVSKLENGKATFLSCSLSQNAKCEGKIFTVEILREKSGQSMSAPAIES